MREGLAFSHQDELCFFPVVTLLDFVFQFQSSRNLSSVPHMLPRLSCQLPCGPVTIHLILRTLSSSIFLTFPLTGPHNSTCPLLPRAPGPPSCRTQAHLTPRSLVAVFLRCPAGPDMSPHLVLHPDTTFHEISIRHISPMPGAPPHPC